MPSCVPMMLFLHIAARPSANAASFETRLNAFRYCWGSSATTHILLALYFLCLVKLKKRHGQTYALFFAAFVGTLPWLPMPSMSRTSTSSGVCFLTALFCLEMIPIKKNVYTKTIPNPTKYMMLFVIFASLSDGNGKSQNGNGPKSYIDAL